MLNDRLRNKENVCVKSTVDKIYLEYNRSFHFAYYQPFNELFVHNTPDDITFSFPSLVQQSSVVVHTLMHCEYESRQRLILPKYWSQLSPLKFSCYQFGHNPFHAQPLTPSGIVLNVRPRCDETYSDQKEYMPFTVSVLYTRQDEFYISQEALPDFIWTAERNSSRLPRLEPYKSSRFLLSQSLLLSSTNSHIDNCILLPSLPDICTNSFHHSSQNADHLRYHVSI